MLTIVNFSNIVSGRNSNYVEIKNYTMDNHVKTIYDNYKTYNNSTAEDIKNIN